jgi:diguanylate cyclase (GGDEF)-like protein
MTPAHVMIVDDDPAAAEAAAELVRDLGHRVTVCFSWTDALRVFGRGGVDLVLMDAVMPTVDGFKLTKILRGRSPEYVPIVFLTSLGDQSVREQCVRVGADDVLLKPPDPIELRLRLHAMLRIRTLTRELESRGRALARLAAIDGLTAVGNRRSFDDRLTHELIRARDEDLPLSLLLLDIDHFKRVNDDYGHRVGDEILAQFGQMLSEVTRAGDVPFRYGGEEFAVVCCGTTSDDAMHIAERIRSTFCRISRSHVCGAQTLSVGVCGTDQVPADATTGQLVEAADAALYRAKAGGRDRVCRYDRDRDRRAA